MFNAVKYWLDIKEVDKSNWKIKNIPNGDIFYFWNLECFFTQGLIYPYPYSLNSYTKE